MACHVRERVAYDGRVSSLGFFPSGNTPVGANTRFVSTGVLPVISFSQLTAYAVALASLNKLATFLTES